MTTGVYDDADPGARHTVDLIDALWRVAAEYVDPDDDECDVQCAVLAAFALKRGWTPVEFDRWIVAAVGRLARRSG